MTGASAYGDDEEDVREVADPHLPPGLICNRKVLLTSTTFKIMVHSPIFLSFHFLICQVSELPTSVSLKLMASTPLVYVPPFLLTCHNLL
jgi:hypothetical protein